MLEVHTNVKGGFIPILIIPARKEVFVTNKWKALKAENVYIV
jgi:hypothetical protein